MGGYPKAKIALTLDKEYAIICPRCNSIVSLEEEQFEEDEIGECEMCKQLVFIPWKEYSDHQGIR